MNRLARVRLAVLALAIASVLLAVPSAQQPMTPRLVTVGGGAGGPDVTALREWDARIRALTRDGDLRVRRVDTDDLVPGREHERLDQYHGGVRVFGGELVRQVDRGQTVSVFGTIYEGITAGTEPTLSPSEATAVVSGLTGVVPSGHNGPELVVLPRDEGGFVLAYWMRAFDLNGVTVYFIDAHTGAVALSYSDLQTAVGTGKGVQGDTKKLATTDRTTKFIAYDQMRPATVLTFDLKGDLERTMRFLNNQVNLTEDDLATDTDNDWTDPAAVDGHVYGGWTYDYLYKRFGRQGLNGQNLRMAGIVHPVKREDVLTQPLSVVNLFYLNAFYAGNGVMVYGEGLPANLTAGGYRWNYFAGALDVVAHELAHGVTDFTSDLIYRNESGALNEAFSDMIGAGAEFFFQEVGSAYLRADYLIGEDLTSPMSGFRSMANPGAFGDPDHYSKRYTGSADNGGVHHNSGIANHAFYLAIEGGVNRTSGLSVTGVGAANRERIEKTFYRAFTQLLPASATFSVARAATLQAARDLYGANSDAERSIAQAWTACGVN